MESNNLFIYFGPRKAKGKYTILFIYLFSFCDNLVVIRRKRIFKFFFLVNTKMGLFFFFSKQHNFLKYLGKKNQVKLIQLHSFFFFFLNLSSKYCGNRIKHNTWNSSLINSSSKKVNKFGIVLLWQSDQTKYLELEFGKFEFHLELEFQKSTT